MILTNILSDSKTNCIPVLLFIFTALVAFLRCVKGPSVRNEAFFISESRLQVSVSLI